MAQGSVKPLDQGQSIEHAADECLLILLCRCFFQDTRRNKFGDVEYCKMHHLMHDLAQEVAGKQICIANSSPSNLDESV